MKNIYPILKLTDRHTLVERRRDDGTIVEYIICNGLKPVENGESNEYCWESGMYSFTLEGAIKTAALRCYEPIRRYAIITISSDGDMEEEIFDDYDKAHSTMERRFKNCRDSEDCTYHEYSTRLYEETAFVEYGEYGWHKWKLIEIKVD